jgi:hypothetical protein
MQILRRKTNLIAVVATLIYASSAIWMNYPGHPLKDPVLERQWTNAAHVAETVSIYWHSGFPGHWYTLQLLQDGKLRLYRYSNTTLLLNIGLCVFGVAAVFIWLSEIRVTLFSMLCLITLSAVLVWADMRFQNLSYDYTFPLFFFLPSFLLAVNRLKGRGNKYKYRRGISHNIPSPV